MLLIALHRKYSQVNPDERRNTILEDIIDFYHDPLYNIFPNLKKHHNAEIILDASKQVIDESLFENLDLSHSVYVSGGDTE